MIYTAVFVKTDHICSDDVLLLQGVHRNYEHRWFFNINLDNILLRETIDIHSDEDILWDIIETVIRGNTMNIPYIQSIGTLAQMPKDIKKAKEYKKLYGKQL